MSSDESKDSNQDPEPRTLIVGNVDAWISAGRSLPDDPCLHYASIDDISREMLTALNPDIVLSPLLGDGFDALDLAVLLENFNFRGRFRALCPQVPNPTLVAAEVQALCPSVNFDLFVVEDPDTRRLN
ncbi:hypothetical protein ACFE33_08775 [Falsihalocynthiibacter sp. SS001]|uniref:hypothetical protein n=1 Tax=Falsihalocynthiibacter sp. SS001 TaxID=3349698 RepID=UPI0036D33AC6